MISLHVSKPVAILCLLSQVFQLGISATVKEWKWTNWIECKDKYACNNVTKRYCTGDPSGRSCGEISQSNYMRTLTGCTYEKSTKCNSWNTVFRSNCKNDACDYIIRTECLTISSCYLTYYHTCNPENYIDCVGQWSKWRVKQSCEDSDGKMRRECLYEGEPSIKCAGNVNQTTFQEKPYHGNDENVICNYDFVPDLIIYPSENTPTALTTTQNAATQKTTTQNTATQKTTKQKTTTQKTTTQSPASTSLVIIFAILIVLILTILGGWLIRKHIQRRKKGSSIAMENVTYRATAGPDEQMQPRSTPVNENRYEEPATTSRIEEIAANNEADYHIYEVLLLNTEYENTRLQHGTGRELLTNDLSGNCDGNTESNYVQVNTGAKQEQTRNQYENIKQHQDAQANTEAKQEQTRNQYENIKQHQDAQNSLLNDENGYLMPRIFSESHEMPTDSYGYMEFDGNTSSNDSLKS